MALIICPDCGKEISDKAERCINCGRPMLNRKISSNIKSESISKYYSYAYLIGVLLMCIGPFLPYNYNRYGYDNMFSLGSGMAGRGILIVIISVICLLSKSYSVLKNLEFSPKMCIIDAAFRFLLQVLYTVLLFAYDVALRAIIYFESLNKNSPEQYPPQKSIGFYIITLGLIISYIAIVPIIVDAIRVNRNK